MKRILLVVVALSACRSVPSAFPQRSGLASGASSAREALDLYMTAVKAQDLQAMSLAWGSRRGPVRDDGDMTQEALYKREMIQQCLTDHDTYKVVGAPRTPHADSAVFNVEIKKGTLIRQSSFITVRARSSRWYLLAFDPDKLKDLCRNVGGGS